MVLELSLARHFNTAVAGAGAGGGQHPHVAAESLQHLTAGQEASHQQGSLLRRHCLSDSGTQNTLSPVTFSVNANLA